MADITVTAANVLKSTNAQTGSGIAGETITAGQCLYIKSTDSKLYKAQCDGTAEEAGIVGIALHGASAGQPLVYQNFGKITIGGTVAVGEVYGVSSAAGGIAAVGDCTTGLRRALIGYGTSVTEIELLLKDTATVRG